MRPSTIPHFMTFADKNRFFGRVRAHASVVATFPWIDGKIIPEMGRISKRILDSIPKFQGRFPITLPELEQNKKRLLAAADKWAAFNLPAGVKREVGLFDSWYDRDLAFEIVEKFKYPLPCTDFFASWDPYPASGAEYLIKRLFGEKKIDVLQIACNFGPILGYLKSNLPHIHIKGLDADLGAVDLADATWGEGVVNLGLSSHLPFSDASFDFVFSRHFFCSSYAFWCAPLQIAEVKPEHFDSFSKRFESDELYSVSRLNMMSSIAEIARVLKPGGAYFSYSEGEPGIQFPFFPYVLQLDPLRRFFTRMDMSGANVYFKSESEEAFLKATEQLNVESDQP